MSAVEWFGPWMCGTYALLTPGAVCLIVGVASPRRREVAFGLAAVAGFAGFVAIILGAAVVFA